MLRTLPTATLAVFALSALANASAQDSYSSRPFSVVVDNKPGSGGNIASDFLVKAAPDGRAVDGGGDYQCAGGQRERPIRSFDNHVQSKVAGSSAAFGSSGIGGSGHLAGELLNSAAELNNQHIAYRGGAPAINDLLGGHLLQPHQCLAAYPGGQVARTGHDRPQVAQSLARCCAKAQCSHRGFAHAWD